MFHQQSSIFSSLLWQTPKAPQSSFWWTLQRRGSIMKIAICSFGASRSAFRSCKCHLRMPSSINNSLPILTGLVSQSKFMIIIDPARKGSMASHLVWKDDDDSGHCRPLNRLYYYCFVKQKQSFPCFLNGEIKAIIWRDALACIGGIFFVLLFILFSWISL